VAIRASPGSESMSALPVGELFNQVEVRGPNSVLGGDDLSRERLESGDQLVELGCF
jgi:hypothetical protein